MPKLKTNSGTKKRFRLTGTGKLRITQSGKRHGMRKKTKTQIRDLRGSIIMTGQQAHNIKKKLLPYGI